VVGSSDTPFHCGPQRSTTAAVSHVWAHVIARINDRGKCYSFDVHFLLSESYLECFYYGNTDHNDFVRRSSVTKTTCLGFHPSTLSS
jgi:hypothetical protein